MFFDDLAQIPELAGNSGFSIFAVPDPLIDAVKNPAITVEPTDGKIPIDAVREIIDLCGTRQQQDFFVLVKNADAMNESAENAFLKLLEEPKENYHIVFTVKNPSGLLPTILSRGNLFVLRQENPLAAPLDADATVKMYAKRLLTASPRNLVDLMNAITSEKEYKKTGNARPFTLKIVACAIDMTYKSYFKTSNVKLLNRLPDLLKLYDNLSKNGHIKLHLVADLW